MRPRRPTCVALAFAVATVGACHVDARSEDKVMLEAKESFARAAGVAAAEIRDLRSVPLGRAPVQVGVVEREDGSVCIAVGAGVAVELGDADQVLPLGLVDLGGPGFDLDLTAEPSALTVPDAASRPALLVRLRQSLSSGEERDALAILVDQPDLKLVLAQPIRSMVAARGGFETPRISGERRAGAAVIDLVMLQHALPAPSAAAAMPGPPLTQRFVWRDGEFAPAR